jgi:hypothetical protein
MAGAEPAITEEVRIMPFHHVENPSLLDVVGTATVFDTFGQ